MPDASKPMTPQHAIDELDALTGEDSAEDHETAEEILCLLLDQLGHPKVVAAFTAAAERCWFGYHHP